MPSNYRPRTRVKSHRAGFINMQRDLCPSMPSSCQALLLHQVRPCRTCAHLPCWPSFAFSFPPCDCTFLVLPSCHFSSAAKTHTSLQQFVRSYPSDRGSVVSSPACIYARLFRPLAVACKVQACLPQACTDTLRTLLLSGSVAPAALPPSLSLTHTTPSRPTCTSHPGNPVTCLHAEIAY